MDEKLTFYLRDVFKSDERASEKLIKEVQAQIDFELPLDYLALMKEFNGGEGEVGENSWLNLFRLEELIEVNRDYSLLMEQIPDYYLFGKDAADTGYAFNKKNKSIHSFGLMSDFETDYIKYCADSFRGFIEYLHNE